MLQWFPDQMTHLAPTSPVLTITLLGGFGLHVARQGPIVLPRKARVLLAYLTMQKSQTASRETVVDLLRTDRGVG
jgi:DNA-binding SARP family transcriptional activator